jgi:hypothetical protein
MNRAFDLQHKNLLFLLSACNANCLDALECPVDNLAHVLVEFPDSQVERLEASPEGLEAPSACSGVYLEASRVFGDLPVPPMLA